MAPRNVLGADLGTVTNNTYRNEVLGFSYPMPDGWYVVPDDANGESQSKGRYLPGGSLLPLMADLHTGKPLKNRLLIIADEASKYHGALSVQAYVGKVVRAQTNR